jgi:hypothetical protein
MKNTPPFPLDQAALIACAALLVALTGCETDGSSRRPGYGNHSSVQVHGSVVYQDDYDYYPAYETYYSRNRREYVYRDGNTWVRRPEPRGVTIDLFFAAPSVRLDFRDAPEKHHRKVVRSYPKNWQRPDSNRAHQDDGKDKRKKDDKKKKDKKQDDRKDNRRD